ncbi:MAG: hypothetical protein WD844_08215 [Thermoleophilaceae bacterium]
MPTVIARRAALAALATLFVPPAAPAAAQRTFGTPPIPISVGPGGQAANGPSGGAALSGDNRRARIAAYHSDASNLVSGDGNDVSDVFIWRRPRGSNGLNLPRPVGTVQRVSLAGRSGEANGPSLNPSVDGSLRRSPNCVAFQSQATNLSGADRDSRWDIYVRDLRRRRTTLVSRGISPDATDPAIDGGCRQVAFQAGGRAYLGNTRGSRPRSLGRGSNPDISLDGTAVVWERGSSVVIRRAGATSTVARGSNPRVSDKEGSVWGVIFDSRSRLTRRDTSRAPDVYTRQVRSRGGGRRTDLISASRRGGRRLPGSSGSGDITAFGTNRGFLTWVTTSGARSTFWYRNNNSGNIDDLAIADGAGATPSITDAVTSARGNFVAYSSTAEQGRFDGNGSVQDVFIKHLGRGDRL